VSAAIGFCPLAANRTCPPTASCSRSVTGIGRREEVQALTGSSLAGLHTAPGPGIGWAPQGVVCNAAFSRSAYWTIARRAVDVEVIEAAWVRGRTEDLDGSMIACGLGDASAGASLWP